MFENPVTDGYVMDWSADGKLIQFSGAREHQFDVWLTSMDNAREPHPYLPKFVAPTFFGRFSPDSRWLAYLAALPDRTVQVFVGSVPAGKGPWQISTAGGDSPTWRRDGKELFYRQETKIMAVPVRLTESSVEAGRPQPLFDVPAGTRFQVSRDGQRFLVAVPAEASGPARIEIDTDWQAVLRK